MNLHMSPGGKAAGREQRRSSPRHTGALPALKGLVMLTEVGLKLMVPVLQWHPSSLPTRPAPLNWSLYLSIESV